MPRFSIILSAILCITIGFIVAGCGKKTSDSESLSPNAPTHNNPSNVASASSIPSKQKPFDINDYAGRLCLAATFVDLGIIAEGKIRSEKVTIINGTDSPVKVVRCASDCGCLTVDFRGFQTIKPKSTQAVEYTLKSVRQKSGIPNKIEVLIDKQNQRERLEAVVVFKCSTMDAGLGAVQMTNAHETTNAPIMPNSPKLASVPDSSDDRRPAMSVAQPEPALIPNASEICLSPSGFDFGDIKPGEPKTLAVKIIRPLDKPLTLGRLYCSCPCVHIDAPKKTFATNEPAEISINIDTNGLAGQKTFEIAVQTLAPEETTLRLTVMLNAKSK